MARGMSGWVRLAAVWLLLLALAAQARAAEVRLEKLSGVVPRFPDYGDGDVLVVEGALLEPGDWMALAALDRPFGLRLENGQRSVPDGAMTGCATLALADLPDVEEIGVGAFADCFALRAVELPAATSLGDGAFSGCVALEEVDLPASLRTMGRNPFAGCTSLRRIRMADGNPDWHSVEGVLYFWSGREIAAYPAGRPSAEFVDGDAVLVRAEAFAGCASLQRVVLPAVEIVWERAFAGCAALEAVDLPVATTVWEGAFADCAALPSIELPVADTLGDGVFAGCGSLARAAIPAAERIPAETFAKCRALLEVRADAARTVGARAFSGCAALQRASFPLATEIEERAFAGCGSLTDLVLPVARWLGKDAFLRCGSLRSLTLGVVPAAGDGAFREAGAKPEVRVPQAALAAYDADYLRGAGFPEGTRVLAGKHMLPEQPEGAWVEASFDPETTFAWEGANVYASPDLTAAVAGRLAGGEEHRDVRVVGARVLTEEGEDGIAVRSAWWRIDSPVAGWVEDFKLGLWNSGFLTDEDEGL